MNDNQNLDAKIAAKVESIGAVAAALMDIMKQQAQKHDNLSWTDMISACAVACRGVAALAMAADPELTLDEARIRMTKRFIEVMSLPPELVRAMKVDDGDAEQVIVVPLKRH